MGNKHERYQRARGIRFSEFQIHFFSELIAVPTGREKHTALRTETHNFLFRCFKFLRSEHLIRFCDKSDFSFFIFFFYFLQFPFVVSIAWRNNNKISNTKPSQTTSMPCVINLANYFARKRAFAKLMQKLYKVKTKLYRVGTSMKSSRFLWLWLRAYEPHKYVHKNGYYLRVIMTLFTFIIIFWNIYFEFSLRVLLALNIEINAKWTFKTMQWDFRRPLSWIEMGKTGEKHSWVVTMTKLIVYGEMKMPRGKDCCCEALQNKNSVTHFDLIDAARRRDIIYYWPHFNRQQSA